MSYRITKSHVEAKVATVNRMLGIENPAWNVVGSIELAGAYGGYAIHRVANESHGVSDLSGHGYGTLREADTFLRGMMAALRIMEDRESGRDA